MTTEKILKSYTVAQLRKEISATNIKGVAKMKRADLHAVIMKNKERFSHLKEQVKTKKPKPTVRTEKKNLPQYESNLMKAKRLAEAKAKAKAKKVDKVKLTKPKPQAPSKNLPLGATMNIRKALFNKEDTEKRKIKIKDVNYFVRKVKELLTRKLGNQAYLNSRGFKNFIEAVIRNQVKAKPRDLFLDGQKGLGNAALVLAKILARNIYPGDWVVYGEEIKNYIGKNIRNWKYSFEYRRGKEPLIKLILTKKLNDWFELEPKYDKPSYKTEYVGGEKPFFYGRGYVGEKYPYELRWIHQEKIGRNVDPPEDDKLSSSSERITGIILESLQGKKTLPKTSAQEKKYFDILLNTDSVYKNLIDMMDKYATMMKI